MSKRKKTEQIWFKISDMTLISSFGVTVNPLPASNIYLKYEQDMVKVENIWSEQGLYQIVLI